MSDLTVYPSVTIEPQTTEIVVATEDTEIAIEVAEYAIEISGVGLQGPPGTGGGGSSFREKLTIASNQTVFTLTQMSAFPHLAKLYLNGAKAEYGIDFVINTSVLTWLSTIALTTDDSLEIYY